MVVSGKRKREVDMVLPVKCKALTKRKKHIESFSKGLQKCKDMFPGLDLTFTPVTDSHAFAIYN